ncbi:GNAT family N-acetyltransferase [Anaerocolumna xylanovorans]|uniref:Acetyltransferase (GNAT) family protein n=1 Tax=Anaerocolumna xylanovorans DSM 12503 TaxID=1121345 RepID=A0A1M7Y3X6_9FIRM|nr:GNAT family N-acetyltransferase [Anaerocolumna xylanovorans]SHO46779.1 Acetyltransferase (GNAT) family protein [Anaerocolumna xylanovorans DSM 12503]
MKNVEIRSFNVAYMEYFVIMFTRYFRDDFKIEITDKKINESCTRIADFSLSGISTLDFLIVDEKPVGFIYYQIDTPQSNWCEREGWGFIREIYIDPVLRKYGLGARLILHAEEMLYSRGTKNIYLTSDNNATFWESLGYRNANEVSTINHDPIYEKNKS